MGRKAKFLYERKIDIITKCLQGKYSANYKANILDISFAGVFEWISLYESFGKKGLIIDHKSNWRYQNIFIFLLFT